MIAKTGVGMSHHHNPNVAGREEGRWIPYYLPQWSSRERSAARYEVGGGRLRLLIEAKQQPW
ncbi:MAG: hypothetical protein M3Q62_00565 [Actinomycetota bacterium]|jgi:hypothetical protein|nr:hypothetical protein [Actinomycetota bacterium]MDQ3497064.1 hypothetical protein [Actinomycetota bacterium]